MKTLTKLLILAILVSGCTANRYLLTDKGKDNRFLIDLIKESSKTGKIGKKPIIVVDGVPKRFDYELKSKRLQFSKNDIENIDILKKDIGIKIYGDFAKEGVLVLTTKSKPDKPAETFDNSKVLILLEDKEISKSEMEKMDPKDIESLEVIKDKDKVRQYTTENYDGVIIIHKKKKE